MVLPLVLCLCPLPIANMDQPSDWENYLNNISDLRGFGSRGQESSSSEEASCQQSSSWYLTITWIPLNLNSFSSSQEGVKGKELEEHRQRAVLVAWPVNNHIVAWRDPDQWIISRLFNSLASNIDTVAWSVINLEITSLRMISILIWRLYLDTYTKWWNAGISDTF